MSDATLKMKLSPKSAGALFSKACRLEDENEQLKAKVAELERCVDDGSDSWLLRKQAEAVESFLSQQAPLLDRYRPQPINEEDHCCEFNLLRDRERLHSEARRLRQQANELENNQ